MLVETICITFQIAPKCEAVGYREIDYLNLSNQSINLSIKTYARIRTHAQTQTYTYTIKSKRKKGNNKESPVVWI